MLSLEGAIQVIEREVSNNYNKTFPSSLLRNNPEAIAKYLKTQAQIALDFPELSTAAIQEIIRCVAGKEIKWSNYYIRPGTIIENCDIILQREKEKEKTGGISIEDLNNYFYHKYLYFNGDENGDEIIYVENIHRDAYGNLCVDGVLIIFDLQDISIKFSEVEDYHFSWFYYFRSDNHNGEWIDTGELKDALLSQPTDTNLPTHVMTAEEVKNHLKTIITEFLTDFELDFDF